jgi:hypothetical protein
MEPPSYMMLNLKLPHHKIYITGYLSKDVYTLQFYGLLVLNAFRFIISFTLQISWLAKLRRSTGFSRTALELL